MRRMLKEVAPISQDQILNEVLNPLIRHQNALNVFQQSNNSIILSGSPSKQLKLNTSPSIRPMDMKDGMNQMNSGNPQLQSFNSLPGQLIPDLNNLSGVSQTLYVNQLNNQNTRIPPTFGRQLLTIQEDKEEDLQQSPGLQDARMENDSESDGNCFQNFNMRQLPVRLNKIQSSKSTNNILNLDKMQKQNGGRHQYIEVKNIKHIQNQEQLNKIQSNADNLHQDNMTIMGSMRNVSQQPDDFMHVKKFTNLDTYHQENLNGTNIISNEGSLEYKSEEEYCSDFEQDNNKMQRQPQGKYKSTVLQQQNNQNLMTQQQNASQMRMREREPSKEADIDSIIMSESLDQMLEETPNHIIYNQQQSFQKRRQTIDPPQTSSPSQFKEQCIEKIDQHKKNFQSQNKDGISKDQYGSPVSPCLMNKNHHNESEQKIVNTQQINQQTELNNQLTQQILQQSILNNYIQAQFPNQQFRSGQWDHHQNQEQVQQQLEQLNQFDQVNSSMQALKQQLQMHTEYCHSQAILNKSGENQRENNLQEQQELQNIDSAAQQNDASQDTNVPLNETRQFELKQSQKVPSISKMSKKINKRIQDYESMSQKSIGSNRSLKSNNTKTRLLNIVQHGDQKAMEKPENHEDQNKDTSMANEEDTVDKLNAQDDIAPPSTLQRMIGPLTIKQRHDKIVKYMMKKRMKGHGKKFTYECRKQVAEKRLRIKGRFVTKNQAFEILGLKEDDLRTNDCLQKLLEQHYNINQMQQYNTEVPYTSHIAQIMRHQLSKQSGPIQLSIDQSQTSKMYMASTQQKNMLQLNSLVQNEKGESKMVKIRNFQALFDNFLPNKNIDTLNAQMAGSNDPQSSSNDPVPEMGFDSLSKQSSKIEDPTPHYSVENPSREYHFQKQYKPATSRQDSFMNTQEPNVDLLSAYRYQQVSILELQEALQKQESINGGDIVTFENYIQPLFKIERVVRFQNQDQQSLDEIFE